MIPLAAQTYDVLEAFDRQFRAWLARTRAPSCTRGCAACCELLCLVTWPEALLVAEVIRDRGDVAHYLPALTWQAEQASFDGVDSVTYFARRIRCAFLTDERDCAIYDARPAPCRFHVAFTPPAMCEDRTPGRRTEHIDQAPILRAAIAPLLEDLDRQGCAEAREVGPLPVMVLAALRELGEDVGTPVTPREWMDRHGLHVWGQVRGDLRAAREEARRGP